MSTRANAPNTNPSRNKPGVTAPPEASKKPSANEHSNRLEKIEHSVRMLTGLIRLEFHREETESSCGFAWVNPREFQPLCRTASEQVFTGAQIIEENRAIAHIAGFLDNFGLANAWWSDFITNTPCAGSGDIEWLDMKEFIQVRVPYGFNDVEENLHFLRTEIAQIAGDNHPVTNSGTPKQTFTVGEFCDLMGVSNGTLNKYAKRAGVTTPTRGKRNHSYTLDEVLVLLEFMASKSSAKDTRTRCQQAYDNLK
jgi:hypothetical protein